MSNPHFSQQALEIKRKFVRYISHEIRTPLNTVFLGLKLLEKEIMEENPQDPRLETIRDTRVSSDIALTVLNELLLFDKLESGSVMLELSSHIPCDFVIEALKSFHIQVCT